MIFAEFWSLRTGIPRNQDLRILYEKLNAEYVPGFEGYFEVSSLGNFPKSSALQLYEFFKYISLFIILIVFDCANAHN